MHGIIALDIDGTVTAEHSSVPIEVAEYLKHLSLEGWDILFITGRTLARTREMLSTFKFSFHIAVQNGAQIFRIPSEERIVKRFLPSGILPSIVEAAAGESTGVVLYAGDIQKDICYYHAADFTGEGLEYVLQRAAAFGEEWKEVGSLLRFEASDFPAFKLIGGRGALERIVEKVDSAVIDIQVIRDPFGEGMYVAQGTAAGASKGTALKNFQDWQSDGHKTIVAGDDFNDISMLQRADIKVVMDTAPESVRSLADIIAPPAAKNGIIEGLKKAVAAAKKIN